MIAALPAAYVSLDSAIWHRRLGHVGKDRLSKTIAATTNIELIKSTSDNMLYKACELSKSYRYTNRY